VWNFQQVSYFLSKQKWCSITPNNICLDPVSLAIQTIRNDIQTNTNKSKPIGWWYTYSMPKSQIFLSSLWLSCSTSLRLKRTSFGSEERHLTTPRHMDNISYHAAWSENNIVVWLLRVWRQQRAGLKRFIYSTKHEVLTISPKSVIYIYYICTLFDITTAHD
jgi:preprotein translocase subunit Sec61beta